MRSINYYIRDEKNHPFAAITVIEEDGKLARGVAICNPCDQFCKVEGRERSLLRAVKALRKEKTFAPIRRFEVDMHMKAKCEFMPVLTDFEVELLAEPVDK